MHDKLLVPPREAAWMLGGISTRHLWALTWPRGPIPCVRLGRRVFYRPGDLERFAEEQKAGACAAASAGAGPGCAQESR